MRAERQLRAHAARRPQRRRGDDGYLQSSDPARPKPPQERQPARPPVVTISAPSAADELVDAATTPLRSPERRATRPSVTWTTNYGASGTAIGRDRWSVANFALPVGKTVVTVTARNAVGDLAIRYADHHAAAGERHSARHYVAYG